VSGVAAGMGVILVMLVYLKLSGQPLIDRSGLEEADLAAERKMTIWAAISPWILLTVFSCGEHACPAVFDLTFKQLAMPWRSSPAQPKRCAFSGRLISGFW